MLLPSNASLMKGFAIRKKCARGFMENWARTYFKASIDLNSPKGTCQRTRGDSREFLFFFILSTGVLLFSENQLWARVCSKWACTPQPEHCCFSTHVNGSVRTKAKSGLSWKPYLRAHSKQICGTIILYLEIHLSFRGHF